MADEWFNLRLELGDDTGSTRPPVVAQVGWGIDPVDPDRALAIAFDRLVCAMEGMYSTFEPRKAHLAALLVKALYQSHHGDPADLQALAKAAQAVVERYHIEATEGA